MIRRLMTEGHCRGVRFQLLAAATTPARPALSGLGATWSSGSTALERQRPGDHYVVSSWHPATRTSLRCLAQSAESTSNKAEEATSAGGEKSTDGAETATGQESTAGGDKAETNADSTKEASASCEAGASEDAAASGKADAADEKDTPSETPEERLACEVAELQEKIRSKKHSLLLSLADFENEKKRLLKERESRRQRAMISFADKMVEIFNEFDTLVLASATAESGALSESCKSLQEGVALTVDLHKSTLERFGVEQFSVEPGQPFVGARHESLGNIEREDLAVNTVAEQVQPGWHLKEGKSSPSVLRKAQVRQVRHGPESPPPPP